MENKRTCLYDKHVALGALISPFGGNNTDMGPTGNNAVTFTSQFNLGEGSTLNINTGDAEVPNRTEDKVVFYAFPHIQESLNTIP